MKDKAQIIEQAGKSLLAGQTESARQIIQQHYPFTVVPKSGRRYSELDMLRIFRRDGFIDRYSGTRLIFPGLLRLLSRNLSEDFPFHPNWKMSVTHPAYWELMPTIDHLVPVSRGGADVAANWMTTSALNNSAKANWTLEELNWTLQSAGDLAAWDGLTSLFLLMMEQDQTTRTDPYLRRWYRAVQQAQLD